MTQEDEVIEQVDPLNVTRWSAKFTTLKGVKRTRFRTYLYVKQCAQCYYCKGTMTLQVKNKKYAHTPFDNFASFEHLYDEMSPRGKQQALSDVVLACVKCNLRRNAERVERMLDYYQQFFPSRSALGRFYKNGGYIKLVQKFGHWEAQATGEGDTHERNVQNSQ